jgi:hypothetical protein
MNSRTIDVVTDWETVSAPEGYEGLHELADAEFSGAVSAGMTWAFFLNGRVIGVFEGDIEDFEDADLTAYRAADPSLPLLFAMRERGGETRARYYTNDTPLSDADQTLSNGGFTGYIELSENVLSGDYYVVYHGGKSMSAAFVGNTDRLVTGEEAFETAADEVGIYEVIDADVEITEIPAVPDSTGEEDAEDEPTDESGGQHTANEPTESSLTAEPTTDADSGVDSDSEADADSGVDSDQEADASPETASDAENEDATTSPPPASADAAAVGTEETGEDTGASAADRPPVDDGSSAGADENTAATDDRAESSGEPIEANAEGERDAAASTSASGESNSATASAAATAASGDDDVFSDEERWREARSIPSLDPSESSSNGTAASASDEGDRQSARERVAQMQKQRTARRKARKREKQASERQQAAGKRREKSGQTQERGRKSNGSNDAPSDVERLEKRLSRSRNRIEKLESERDELIEERDALQAERAEYRERVEELESEREELRAEIERLETELENASASSESATEETRESMSPDRALSGTNLFVRYAQKGEATLKHAHDGDASRDDVRENLRLEHHTTFEIDGVAVEGQPYEEFLRDSTEYAFAKWVVTELLYEIGETGNRSGLSGVFDVIPDIDRVELYGTVGADTDDGVEQRDFDVIFRDKMGDPLFVADINASRNATTEAMVESLVANTGTIAEGDESLAAGFYVTESFYEPGALETVSEETGGGLFSRSSKLSYVKLSRKRGYHLCLVEARNGEFHLNVPDL